MLVTKLACPSFTKTSGCFASVISRPAPRATSCIFSAISFNSMFAPIYSGPTLFALIIDPFPAASSIFCRAAKKGKGQAVLLFREKECGFNPQRAAWTDNGRRYPAAGRQWSFLHFSSRFASWMAACTAAPEEIPTSTPSLRPISFPAAKASWLVTVKISS